MLKVQLLFLLLIFLSVKSQTVFENGVTELPPTYQMSHGSFDPFLNKVIHPPSFYLRNHEFEDFKYVPTLSTPFLHSKGQRKDEIYYKNLNNIPKSVTIASSVTSEYELPMYNKDALPSYPVQLDHTTQHNISVSSSTSPVDNTNKYVLDSLFSDSPITSLSFDTSSEPKPLNPLPSSTPINILNENNFDDIKGNPIVTFPDYSAVLTTSATPTSFPLTSTFETPYPINEEEKTESNLPPSTLHTTTCDQDVCFDNNLYASEESNVAIIVHPENHESSFPMNNDLLYSYINPSENLNYYIPTTNFESFDMTTNPTDLSLITSSTVLPVLSDTTLVTLNNNIDDLVNYQKRSVTTPKPEVIIVYPEGYSKSNFENVDASRHPKRNDSFNGELTQSKHPDINASEINTTELTEITPTIPNPDTFSNLEPEFENKAPNNLPTEGILTNQNEFPRSYDYETNSFRSNRMCKEQNAFLDVGGSHRFYVECQDYQPIIKFCPGEYNFNFNIKWPVYPCKKLFDEDKDSGF